MPYIPLRFTQGRVEVDPVIPPQFVNPSVEKFLDTISRMQTPDLIRERELIRQELGLEHIRSELNHLGSVVEDDVGAARG